MKKFQELIEEQEINPELKSTVQEVWNACLMAVAGELELVMAEIRFRKNRETSPPGSEKTYEACEELLNNFLQSLKPDPGGVF